MDRIKTFVRTSLIGGLVVILPLAVLILAIKWLFKLVTAIVSPITNVVLATSNLQELAADIISIGVVLAVCFLVGVFVRTQLGKIIFDTIEGKLLKSVPGYALTKETILQFIGNKKAPFTKVAFARVFNNDTLVTAFITDSHENGYYTVFVPTGPNPTSGNIYHLHPDQLYILNVSVERTMKSIISCGAGSHHLMDTYQSQYQAAQNHFKKIDGNIDKN